MTPMALREYPRRVGRRLEPPLRLYRSSRRKTATQRDQRLQKPRPSCSRQLALRTPPWNQVEANGRNPGPLPYGLARLGRQSATSSDLATTHGTPAAKHAPSPTSSSLDARPTSPKE